MQCRWQQEESVDGTHEPGVLLVNFDPALTETMREVHYLTRMSDTLPAAIPRQATMVGFLHTHCMAWC